MNTHIRTGLAALAAATAAVAALAGPAAAAPTPTFLAASQLPPHPSSAWHAGRVSSGLPDPLPFCFGDMLPGGSATRYREYRTDLDANALQTTVVASTTTKAKALATHLNEAIARCAVETEQQFPEINASKRDYGTLPVEEGAHVYGVHTRASWGAVDIHLFSVGRDGRTVTVVHWGQMGGFDDAPVSAFKKTTTTAVNRLF